MVFLLLGIRMLLQVVLPFVGLKDIVMYIP